MNGWRFFLIGLLCLLLPVRGAVAAAVLCGSGDQGAAAAAQLADLPQATDDAALHPAHPHHHHADAGANASAADSSTSHLPHGSTAHAGGCHTCAAFCGAAALPSAPLVLPAVPAPSALRFPPLTLAASVYQTDGQDRPPRRA